MFYFEPQLVLQKRILGWLVPKEWRHEFPAWFWPNFNTGPAQWNFRFYAESNYVKHKPLERSIAQHSKNQWSKLNVCDCIFVLDYGLGT